MRNVDGMGTGAWALKEYRGLIGIWADERAAVRIVSQEPLLGDGQPASTPSQQ